MKVANDRLSINSNFLVYKITPRFTTKQRGRDKRITLYLDKWTEIFNIHGWSNKSKLEKQELRHSIIEDLFGEYIQPSLFSHTAWDIVFDALEQLKQNGILIWSKDIAKKSVESGTRRRIIWNIRHAGIDRDSIDVPEANAGYIQKIAYDKFNQNTDFTTLSLHQLEMLLYTIKNRVRSKNEKHENLLQQEESEDEEPYEF